MVKIKIKAEEPQVISQDEENDVQQNENTEKKSDDTYYKIVKVKLVEPLGTGFMMAIGFALLFFILFVLYLLLKAALGIPPF